MEEKRREGKEKRIGREGEWKREELRDKEWGRLGVKIAVRKTFFFPNVGKSIKTYYTQQITISGADLVGGA